jgi:hypothetical protein
MEAEEVARLGGKPPPTHTQVALTGQWLKTGPGHLVGIIAQWWCCVWRWASPREGKSQENKPGLQKDTDTGSVPPCHSAAVTVCGQTVQGTVTP